MVVPREGRGTEALQKGSGLGMPKVTLPLAAVDTAPMGRRMRDRDTAGAQLGVVGEVPEGKEERVMGVPGVDPTRAAATSELR